MKGHISEKTQELGCIRSNGNEADFSVSELIAATSYRHLKQGSHPLKARL